MVFVELEGDESGLEFALRVSKVSMVYSVDCEDGGYQTRILLDDGTVFQVKGTYEEVLGKVKAHMDASLEKEQEMLKNVTEQMAYQFKHHHVGQEDAI